MLRVSSPQEPEKLKQRGEDLSGVNRLKVAILRGGGMKLTREPKLPERMSEQYFVTQTLSSG